MKMGVITTDKADSKRIKKNYSDICMLKVSVIYKNVWILGES